MLVCTASLGDEWLSGSGRSMSSSFNRCSALADRERQGKIGADIDPYRSDWFAALYESPKITGPNLLAPRFSVSALIIKQFGRLFALNWSNLCTRP
jgi:hypothetical protein